MLFKKIKSRIKNKVISSEKKLVLNNENYEIFKKFTVRKVLSGINIII